MALSTISGTTGITDATITSAKLADFSAAVDLNGVELILDADADTSITADTDDRIDFKLGGVEHISINNSSGDTVIKPMVDGKDIVFQQYDGNKILEINDGNYVAISGAAAGPGELRFYEDTDLGSHYTGFKAGNATASLSYVLPLADGSANQQLTTDGSGTLSWAAGGAVTALNNATANELVTVGSTTTELDAEANLTFDGSVLAATGNITATGTIEPAGDTAAGDNAAIGYTSAEGLILTGQGSTSDITFKNDADETVFTIPTGTDDVLFPDNAKISIGSGSDYQIYHDGTHTYMDNNTGALFMRNNGSVVIEDLSGNNIIRGIDGGAVDLYHNGSAKLTTTSTGLTVTGTVSQTAPPAGSVLQVVSSFAQAYLSTSSTSFVDSGTETAITPSSTSSKILCLYHTGICYQTTSNANFYVNYTLLRGSTNLGHSTGGISGTYLHSGTYNDYGWNVSFNYLDSPSTTSAITYKTQIRTTAGTVYNDLEGRSSLILLEIAG